MGKIDLAILILVGIFTLFGFFRGFVKQIMSAASWLVSLVAASFLTKPVSPYVASSAIGTAVTGKVTAWITDLATFNLPFDPANSTEQLSEAITGMGLPKFIADIIAQNIDLAAVPASISLADVLVPTISKVLITIATFLILFISAFILFKIIGSLLNKLFSGKILGFVNKIFGAVLGLAKGALIVCVIMLLMSTVAGTIPAINDFLAADFEIGGIGIGEYIYENNPLIQLIEGSFNFDDLF